MNHGGGRRRNSILFLAVVAVVAFYLFFPLLLYTPTIVNNIEEESENSSFDLKAAAAASAHSDATIERNILRQGGGLLLQNVYYQSTSDYLTYTIKMLGVLSHGRLVLAPPLFRPTPTRLSKLDKSETMLMGMIRRSTALHPNPTAQTDSFYLLHRACPGEEGGASGVERVRIMVVCGMHGRELFSTELCRNWMLETATSIGRRLEQQQHAKRNSSNNGTAQGACPEQPAGQVAPFDWLFVPISNPTGRDEVTNAKRAYDINRKDQRPELCLRGNKHYVDLNRNWPNPSSEGAGEDPELSDKARLIRHGFRGTRIMSEPETAQLESLLRDFEPHILLSIHTGMFAVLAPFDDSVTEVFRKDNKDIKIANWMAQLGRCTSKLSCVVGRGGEGLYLARGTMVDYAARQQLAKFPMTLEIYGNKSLTNLADDHWATRPALCFDGFNPEDRTSYLKQWHPLWKALYYMLPNDRKYLERVLYYYDKDEDSE
jgi:hypothetical protein